MLLLVAAGAILLFSLIIKRRVSDLRRVAFESGQESKILTSLPIHYCYSFAIWAVVLFLMVLSLDISMGSKYIVLGLILTVWYFIADHYFMQGFEAKAHLENSLSR